MAGAPEPSACVTCGAVLTGPYCAECGERVIESDDARLTTFLRDTASDAFDLDSRLWRSFRALLTKPGLLTGEYLRGRRKPFLGPLQIFLIANVVFFAALSLGVGFNTFTTRLQNHIGQPGYGEIAEHLVGSYGAEESPERTEYAQRFDESTPRYANSLIILMVPMLAFALWLLYGGRRGYLHHIVMSLHLHAFILLIMVGIPLVATILNLVIPDLLVLLNNESAMAVLLGSLLTLYFGLAMRRAYGGGLAASLLRGFATFILLYPIVTVYRMLLFFAVYYSLGA
jgi:hypothetical protein